MQRYIDVGKVLETYSDLYWMDERLLSFQKELDKVYEEINNLPTEIIQCEDCVYSRPYYITGDQYLRIACDNPNGLNKDVSEYDYCSYGEGRKR